MTPIDIDRSQIARRFTPVAPKILATLTSIWQRVQMFMLPKYVYPFLKLWKITWALVILHPRRKRISWIRTIKIWNSIHKRKHYSLIMDKNSLIRWQKHHIRIYRQGHQLINRYFSVPSWAINSLIYIIYIRHCEREKNI